MFRTIFFFLLLHSTMIWALDYATPYGTVTLSNGETYTGHITLERKLSFHDLVKNAPIHLPLHQVYRIETIIESIAPYNNWEVKNNPRMARRWILAIHTWTGQSYWTRLSLNVAVILPNRKRLVFLIPKVQFISTTEKNGPKIISKIEFSPPSPEYKAPTILSLKGDLSPQGTFRNVYILQEQHQLWKEGMITNAGSSYEIPTIMPGNYQFFFVTDKEVIFGLQNTVRTEVMDKDIASDIEILASWANSQAPPHHRIRMLHAVGRHSLAKILVMEEALPNVVNGTRKLELWLCQFHHNRWIINCRYRLLTQTASQPWPVLLHDPRLANVQVPIDAVGVQRWDYYADSK